MVASGQRRVRRQEPGAREKLMAVSTRSERGGSTPLARLLSWVVLAVMAAAAAYTVWIAFANFHRIGV
jgi:hypothetical protein